MPAWKPASEINSAYLMEISEWTMKFWPAHFKEARNCNVCQGRGHIQYSKQHKVARIQNNQGWCTTHYKGHEVEYSCEHCCFQADNYNKQKDLDPETKTAIAKAREETGPPRVPDTPAPMPSTSTPSAIEPTPPFVHPLSIRNPEPRDPTVRQIITPDMDLWMQVVEELRQVNDRLSEQGRDRQVEMERLAEQQAELLKAVKDVGSHVDRLEEETKRLSEQQEELLKEVRVVQSQVLQLSEDVSSNTDFSKVE